MEIEKAFLVLGISPNSSLNEISRAYREKSLKHHPDMQGGDQGTQVELNEAYETAEAYSKIKHEVVPVSTKDLLSKIERELSIPKNAQTAEVFARRIVNKRTRILQTMKNTAWAVGVITAIVALIGKEFLPLTSLTDATGKLRPDVDRILKMYTIACGFFGLALHIAIKMVETKVERFMEHIADRVECAKELASALEFQDIEVCTVNKIGGPTISLFSPFLPDIGIENLREPLVAKAISHGLIQIEKEEELNPDFVQRYKLLFKPSLFKPKLEVKEVVEPVQLTRSDSLSVLGGSLLWLGLTGGGAYYLWFVKSSPWAIAPGILSLPGIGWFLMFAIELFKIIGKENKRAEEVADTNCQDDS